MCVCVRETDCASYKVDENYTRNFRFDYHKIHVLLPKSNKQVMANLKQNLHLPSSSNHTRNYGENIEQVLVSNCSNEKYYVRCYSGERHECSDKAVLFAVETLSEQELAVVRIAWEVTKLGTYTARTCHRRSDGGVWGLHMAGAWKCGAQLEN